MGRTIDGQCWRSRWSLNADVQDGRVGFRVLQVNVTRIGKNKSNRMATAWEVGNLKRIGAQPGDVGNRLSAVIKHLIGGSVVEVVLGGSAIQIDMEMRSPLTPIVKFWAVNDTSTGSNGNEAPCDGLVMVNGGRGNREAAIVMLTGSGLASKLTNSLSEAVANLTVT